MPLTITGAPRQLSDGNFLFGGQGTSFGQSPQDGISFFGAAAVVQPSGGQTPTTRGAAAGVIATILSAVQSPTTPGTLTTAEKTMTLVTAAGSNFQIAAGDVVVVNKPTSQAGLGVGNVRVSAGNTLAVTFAGVNAVTTTPTVSQSYSVVALRGFPPISAVLTPTAAPANSTLEQQFAVAGVRAGELLQVSKPTSQAGLDVVGCRVVATGTIGITFANVTAAPITPTAAETYTVVSLGGIDAVNNDLVVQELFSPGTIAVTTSAEQTLVTTGLATSDTIVGVSKPTAQAGLGIANARVASANNLGLTFGNFTAGIITITATETYSITLKRPNPPAPLVVLNPTLTPAAVAPLTTAEQTFAVTGVVASSVVWVNKPSATQGLGIAGVRVSAAGTIAINYINTSTGTITPPAEAYVVGDFQLPVGDASSTWMQTASVSDTQQGQLANTLRAGLVSLGLIAGT